MTSESQKAQSCQIPSNSQHTLWARKQMSDVQLAVPHSESSFSIKLKCPPFKFIVKDSSEVLQARIQDQIDHNLITQYKKKEEESKNCLGNSLQ